MSIFNTLEFFNDMSPLRGLDVWGEDYALPPANAGGYYCSIPSGFEMSISFILFRLIIVNKVREWAVLRYSIKVLQLEIRFF